MEGCYASHQQSAEELIHGGQGRYFKPQETWTHDFFCLANHVQNCVPTRMEKNEITKKQV